MKKTLEQELIALRRDMKAIKDHLAENIGETYEEAEEAVSDYADEMAEEARNKWDAAKKYARKGREYFEDHPWQAIGAGVALGLAIGLLARRRD